MITSEESSPKQSEKTSLSLSKWELAIIILGSFACMLNQNIISPLLPVMMNTFSIGAEAIQSLTTMYMLVSAIMIPTTAFLSQRYCLKSLFVFSMASFFLGSFLLAWSPFYWIALVGRVFQAISAGIILPLIQTTLLLSVAKEKRGAAMGMVGLLLAFAPVAGPTLAGWIADVFSWHYVFGGISVLAALVLLGSFKFLHYTPTNCTQSLDQLSLISSSLGFGSLLYGFSIAPTKGWLHILTVGSCLVGIVFIFIFVRRQQQLTTPFLELKVFTYRQYSLAVILGMITYISMTSIMIIFPLFVQEVCGHSATTSGLLMIPGALALGVLNPLSGKLFDRYGPRIIAISGFTLISIGSLGFSFLYLDIPLSLLAGFLALRMAGIGLVLMPLVTWGMNALDDKLIVHGVSVFNTFRYGAGAIGTAILITVMTLITNMQTGVSGEVSAKISGINQVGLLSTFLSIICLILSIIYVKNSHEEDPSIS